MKKWIIFTIIILFSLLENHICMAGNEINSIRKEMVLTHWEFQAGVSTARKPSNTKWMPINLPFIWSTNSKFMISGKWGQSNLDSGWFQTQINIPQDWQNKAVYLKINGLQCNAIIWINGKKIDEIDTPIGKINITKFIVIGQNNKILLWVTKWWQDTKMTRQKDFFRNTWIKVMLNWHNYKNINDIRKSIPGGISGYVKLQAVPYSINIKNILVETNYKKKELILHIKYTQRADITGLKFKFQVKQLNGQMNNLPYAVIPLQKSNYLGTHNAILALKWLHPHLWYIGAPYLYNLDVYILGKENNVIDKYPTIRFGFRQIWTKGKELILNGHPIRLRMAYFVQSIPEMLFFQRMGFDAMEFQPNAGFWYGTTGMFPTPSEPIQYGPKDVLNAADTHGWAVLMLVPTVYYVGYSGIGNDFLKKDVQKLYLQYVREWIEQEDRENHPSILMWCPDMDIAGTYNPMKIGEKPTFFDSSAPANIAEKIIKSVDPTRLVYYHSGGQVGGDMQTMNLYLNFVPLQEREDFLSYWNKHGQVSWGAIEFGPPSAFNFFNKGGDVPNITEYSAIYFGDTAYKMEKNMYIKESLKDIAKEPKSSNFWADYNAFGNMVPKMGNWTAYYKFMTLFIRKTNETWRAWGENGGMFPWIFDVGFGCPPGGCKPTGWGAILYQNLTLNSPALKHTPIWVSPIYYAYKNTMQPLLVFIGGKEKRFTSSSHDYYSGTTIQKTIVAVWDGPGNKKIYVNWTFKIHNNIISSGTDNFNLSAGDIIKKPLNIKLSIVKKQTKGVLSIKVFEKGNKNNPYSIDNKTLTIFPAMEKITDIQSSSWAIYDPAGKTIEELAKLGFYPKPIKSGNSLQGITHLIIGFKALKFTTQMPFTLQDINNGLKVLIMEQNISTLEHLGFRVEDVVPRYVFKRVKNSPILSQITNSDLTNWRWKGILLPNSGILSPKTWKGMETSWPAPQYPCNWDTYGSVASVIIETPEKAGFTPILECEFDLAYSPLLQWKYGKGQIIFSQLDITGRIGKEPSAAILLSNMIKYLNNYKGEEKRNGTMLFIGKQGKTFIKSLELKCDFWDKNNKNPSVDFLNKYDAVVIAENSLNIMKNQIENLKIYVKDGGKVIILPQSAKQWGEIQLPWDIKAQSKQIARLFPGNNSLLRGIGPELLHFRTFLNFQQLTCSNIQSKQLLDGFMLKIPSGKGYFLFDQINPQPIFSNKESNLRRTRWNITRFYTQLFTNIGIQTNEKIAKKVLSLSFQQYAPFINIEPWQTIINPIQISSMTKSIDRKIALPALGEQLQGDKWVKNPEEVKNKWVLLNMANNGEINFKTSVEVGKVGYAITYIYSLKKQTINFALGADWWFIFSVNGKIYIDQSKTGRIPEPARKDEIKIRVSLKKGWNKIEMKVASGSAGFGFWCQATNPGNLEISASLERPSYIPSGRITKLLTVAPLKLNLSKLFYVSSLTKDDDPYGFTAW